MTNLKLLLFVLLLAWPCQAETWFDTLPQEKRNTILGKYDCETSGQFEMWPSGSYTRNEHAPLAHSGFSSYLATINTKYDKSAVRWAKRWVTTRPPDSKQDNLPDVAYYSGWFFMPTVPKKCQWLIIFEFMCHRGSTADPIVTIGCNSFSQPKPATITAFGHAGNDSKYMTAGSGLLGRGGTPIPQGQWNHLEVRYVWGKYKTGGMEIWLNGNLEISRYGITTQYAYPPIDTPRQWILCNYAGKGGIDPAKFSIYWDDAAISTAPLGH